MPLIAEADKCPACKGSRTYKGAWCVTCSRTGLSSAARKKRAEDNKNKHAAIYAQKTAECDELKEAILQFKIKTNLDGVLLQAAKDRLKTLEIHAMSYAPRKAFKR